MIGLSVLFITLLTWGIHLIKTYQLCKRQGQLMIWGSALSAYMVGIGIGAMNTTIHHEHGLLTALCLGMFLAVTHSKITETVNN
jgi:multisubunit Na+/H+ antiporter MnhC subunit